MKKIWSVWVLCLLCILTGRAQEASVKRITVDDFYKLKVYHNFDVTYRQNADSAGVIEIMASVGDLSHIECVSKKGELVIRYKGIYDKEQMQGAIILYSTALESVENNGLGLIQIASPITGSGFRGKVIGNGSIDVQQMDFGVVDASVIAGKGTITLNGVCREAELSVTGSGQIEADRLNARDVVCKIRGTGVVGCHATHKLTVRATGNAEVYYRGNPEIHKIALGELSVRSLEGAE